MAAKDFFKATSDLRIFIPDINAGTAIEQFEYAFRSPEHKLINLIGKTTYDLMKDHFNGDNDDAVFLEGIKYIQGAIANLSGIVIFKLDSAERNSTKKMYKYQEDQHLDIYLNNANAELGLLLNHLDANSAKYPAWKETILYKTRVEQIIKTHTDFGRYYFIDESAYFFSKIIFLMKEITADKLEPIIGDFNELSAEDDADLIEKVKQALAYLTVAMSLRRFDFLEIPQTIRNNVSDEKSRTIRTGGQEGAAVAKVSSEIEMKGITYLSTISRMMEKKRTGSIELPEELQEDDDNFYLQT